MMSQKVCTVNVDNAKNIHDCIDKHCRETLDLS